MVGFSKTDSKNILHSYLDGENRKYHASCFALKHILLAQIQILDVSVNVLKTFEILLERNDNI